MVDPIDEFDREMRALAKAARDEIESGVDTGHALAAASSSTDGRAMDDDVSSRRGPSKIVGLFAAAAVLGMIAGGLVIGFRGDEAALIRTNTVQPTVAPATNDVATASVPESVPPSRSADTVVPVPTSTSPAPTVASDVQPIAVDVATPPPLVEPRPFASLPLAPDPNGNGPTVAVTSAGVVVSQPKTSRLTLVGSEGELTEIGIEPDVYHLAGGPDGVVYALAGQVFTEDDPNGLTVRFVAIATSGDRAGEVVAETTLPGLPYTELQVGAFGNGPDGIVDRRPSFDNQLMAHVDAAGHSLLYDWEVAPPILALDAMPDGLQRVSAVNTGLAWDLSVGPSSKVYFEYLEPPPPMASSGGRVIYTLRIGSQAPPDPDVEVRTMPVIAILEPDGSGRWVRLPDDWSVAASDVWGTILMRTSNGVLELARLDDVLAPNAEDADEATFAVPSTCVDGRDCTQLVRMNDGTIVAFEPGSETFLLLDQTGETIQNVVAVDLPEGSRFPNLVSIGPDDTAYLTVLPASAGDPLVDLLAIPLTGQNAGVLSVVETGLDGSGDTDLVPTRQGLASVGCCGFDQVRPDPERPVIPWSGGATLDAPVFEITLSDSGYDLTRRDPDGTATTFPLPTVVSTALRGMPYVVPTDDGGALLEVYQQFDNSSYLVRFRTTWPQFGIDPADVVFLGGTDEPDVRLLEPAGTVIVDEGAVLVRRSLDEIGAPGWPGSTEVDLDADPWASSAPGFNDYIDAEHPSWAQSPMSLAFQLAPQVGPNEQLAALHDEVAGTLTITVTGFLDDSSNGVQTIWPIERDDDGFYRVGVGEYGQQCQLGRGQQDFRSEPCI